MSEDERKNSILSAMRDQRERFFSPGEELPPVDGGGGISPEDFRAYRKISENALAPGVYESGEGERAEKSAVMSAVEEFFDDSSLSDEIFSAIGRRSKPRQAPKPEPEPEEEPISSRELLEQVGRMAAAAKKRHRHLLRQPKIVYDPYNEVINRDKEYDLTDIPVFPEQKGYSFSGGKTAEEKPKKEKRKKKNARQ